MKTFNIYEDNAGGVHAIIRDGGEIVNCVLHLSDLLDGANAAEKFAEGLSNAFCYADDYDPDEYCGTSLYDMCAEIEELDDLIGYQDESGVYVSIPKAMGLNGLDLHGLKY